MSRKHYVEVARVIDAELSINRDNAAVVTAVENLTLSLADLFKRDNSAFDRQRFYTACGLNAMGRRA